MLKRSLKNVIMPNLEESVSFLERFFSDLTETDKTHQESLAFASIPFDDPEDTKLSKFVLELETANGNAIESLVADFEACNGTCFYGGWIDQSVFTITDATWSSANSLRSLVSLLAIKPIEQNGDAVLGFLPESRSSVCFVCVSRENRFVYLRKQSGLDEVVDTATSENQA